MRGVLPRLPQKQQPIATKGAKNNDLRIDFKQKHQQTLLQVTKPVVHAVVSYGTYPTSMLQLRTSSVHRVAWFTGEILDDIKNISKNHGPQHHKSPDQANQQIQMTTKPDVRTAGV